MTHEIDTSTEAVERHLEIEHHHEAGLIPVSTRMLLRALAAERDALRQRAEEAEAEVERLREALENIKTITPLWEGGMDVSKVNLANTLEETRQIARAALRQDEGDES